MADKNQNFRITTDYIFELYDVDTNSYYSCWVEGQDGSAAIKISQVADTSGVAIEITSSNIPDGNESSNYRIKSGILQIYNIDTKKYHTIFIIGDSSRTAVSISQIGEE